MYRSLMRHLMMFAARQFANGSTLKHFTSNGEFVRVDIVKH